MPRYFLLLLLPLLLAATLGSAQAEAAELKSTEASIYKYHAAYYPSGYPAAHDQ